MGLEPKLSACLEGLVLFYSSCVAGRDHSDGSNLSWLQRSVMQSGASVGELALCPNRVLVTDSSPLSLALLCALDTKSRTRAKTNDVRVMAESVKDPSMQSAVMPTAAVTLALSTKLMGDLGGSKVAINMPGGLPAARQLCYHWESCSLHCLSSCAFGSLVTIQQFSGLSRLPWCAVLPRAACVVQLLLL